MARTVTTPRKSTAARTPAARARARFNRFVINEEQELPIPLLEYYSVWETANAYGVSSMDGLLRLIQIMPAEWQMWVASISMDFVDQAIEDAELVDLRGLIDHICIQYHQSGGPPPGHHVPPAELVPMGDSDSDVDDVQAVPEPIEPEQIIPELDQIVPEPVYEDPIGELDLVPDLTSYDYAVAAPMDLDAYHADDEHSPIDLDLYGQPFALDLPLFHEDDPPIPDVPDLPPPLPVELEAGSSRPPGVTRSFKYEPEFLPSVGTTHLQPLATSQMPFLTDPYILDPSSIPSYLHNLYPEVPPPEEQREQYVEDEIEDDETDEEEAEDEIPDEGPQGGTELTFQRAVAEAEGEDEPLFFHLQREDEEHDVEHWDSDAVDMEIQNLLDDESIWADL